MENLLVCNVGFLICPNMVKVTLGSFRTLSLLPKLAWMCKRAVKTFLAISLFEELAQLHWRSPVLALQSLRVMKLTGRPTLAQPFQEELAHFDRLAFT